MSSAGDNRMPSSFKYKQVYEKGKPEHHFPDAFSIRHPPMALAKRAKIFSPFDALKGFGDELSKAQQQTADDFSDDTAPLEQYP